MYDYTRSWLAQPREKRDPAFVGRIFEVPEGTTFATLAARDEYGNFVHEEDLWPLANPSLIGQPGGFLDPEKIRPIIREALEIPSQQSSVLQLHFNMWVGAESHWIPPDVWWKCDHGPIEEDALEGRDCFAGIDVATTQDFTSYALVFPWPEDRGLGFDVLVRTFLPEGTAEARTKQRHEIAAWVAAGELELTPGNSNEFAHFRNRLLADAERFRIREVGFDPFLMRESATILENEGLTLVEVRAGPRTMTGPIQQVELLALKGRLNHGGNRLLAWQVGNVVLKNAEGGMVMLSKDRARERIDSVAALCTAMERAMHQKPRKRSAAYRF
jgi:phage terminase large subunit-like protein